MTALLHSLPTPSSDDLFFDRCVDWLLSLHDETSDPQLRQLVTDVLVELRAMGPVTEEFVPLVLGALGSVQSAFEITQAAA